MNLRLLSHFGVYAVVKNAHTNRFLLIRKARGPYRGLLDLPGGSLQPDELLDDALHREVAEETGCTVVAAKQSGTFSVKFNFQDEFGLPTQLRHIGVLYDTQVTGQPRATGDGQDAAGCLWVPAGSSRDGLTPLAALGIRRALDDQDMR